MSKNEPQQVRQERDLPHPPSRVWAALTDPRALSSWMMPCVGDPSDGPFRFKNDWGDVECEVLDRKEEHRLALSWRSGALDSVVVFSLSPSDTGTRLTVEQSGFPDDEPRFFMGARAGWPRFLDSLSTYLKGKIAA